MGPTATAITAVLAIALLAGLWTALFTADDDHDLLVVAPILTAVYAVGGLALLGGAAYLAGVAT
jgi:hypothetical protein